MIFFKRKSSTAVENNKKPLPPPPPPPPSTPPSLKQQQATHNYIKNSSDSLLQLNLLDNFSSIIDIPQLQQGTEDEQQSVGNTTLDTCSLVSTIGNRTSIYVESTMNKIDPPPERVQAPLPSILSTDHQPVAIIKEKSKKEDTDNTKMNEGLNASDSLIDPEGDIKHTPDDNRTIAPLSFTKEPDSCSSNDIKASKEKQKELAVYSNAIFDDNDEKEVDSTILSSGDVPSPQLEAEPVSFDNVNKDSPTLPPTNAVTEESNKLDDVGATDDTTFAEKEKKPEMDQLFLLDLRSETEVDSLEVSLHEIQDPKPILISLEATNNIETALESNETLVLLSNNEEEEAIVKTPNDEEKFKEEETKKSDMIVKRRSTHSLIPRKQNLHSMMIEQPIAVIQKPLSPSQSNTTKEFNNVHRRGSSGSFIPIPQQNRLSFTMTESKHWSPSSSSDSLSLRSSASSSDSITTTEKKVSHTRLPVNVLNQSSKIPVFATKPSEVSKLVAPSINNISRLPVKRTPATTTAV